MSHKLAFDSKGAMMAYADREIPWHRLGQPMKGLHTIDEMLAAARADYRVSLTRVAAIDDDGNVLLNPDGSPVLIDDSRATVRQDKDGTYVGLSTVGTRYTVHQNEAVTERALAIVGATRGEAVMDTVGVLHDGKEFFASIDLGPLVIDPTGANDRIDRYLLVRNGHNGKVPITYANTDIRAVCKNTVVMGMENAHRVFKARHTANADSVIEDAQRVLEISTAWAKSFKQNAEAMLSINVPAGSARIDGILNKVFPEKAGETDRQKVNREQVHDTIRALYGNERNAGGFGYNGWSIYNSVVEYLDHYRDSRVYERALTSMDENSWVSKAKLATQAAVLTYA
jgi:phage/plasmid-like protein (TIGR03299 family)